MVSDGGCWWWLLVVVLVLLVVVVVVLVSLDLEKQFSKKESESSFKN